MFVDNYFNDILIFCCIEHPKLQLKSTGLCFEHIKQHTRVYDCMLGTLRYKHINLGMQE